MDYKELPKVELHLHLDCSLSFEVVKHLSPSTTLADYTRDYVLPDKCSDLVDYINRANKGAALMQTKEQLRLVTNDLFDQLKADNVIYAEIRFAPHIHLEEGLTAREVVEIVNQATKEAVERTGVEGGVILCTLRHYSEEMSMETVQLVHEFEGSRIIGFDIAADEVGFPIDNHVAAFQYAKKHSLNCTAHAGEARGPESVWETIEHFCPSRLGHGVRSAEDQRLLNYLKDKDIHLEVCPTSNIQTNVYDRFEDHRISEIYDHGVSMSINTDARAISGTTLTREYEKLERVFGWTLDHLRKCNLEAIDHAFASDEVKEKIRSILKEAYK
jgi:adenosine deaminase